MAAQSETLAAEREALDQRVSELDGREADAAAREAELEVLAGRVAEAEAALATEREQALAAVKALVA